MTGKYLIIPLTLSIDLSKTVRQSLCVATGVACAQPNGLALLRLVKYNEQYFTKLTLLLLLTYCRPSSLSGGNGVVAMYDCAQFLLRT